jgi:hypothetical protein
VNTIRRRLSAVDREGGFVLIMALGIGMVLLFLVVAATTFSVSDMTKTRTDEDSTGALAAAYAGVDEYESRLAGDSSYGQYGNPLSKFTIATGSSVIAPAATSANDAFDVTKGGKWTYVSGSDKTASFRYEVDNSHFASAGQLRLRVTGRVDNVTRSVIANLKGKGFIDFLYFTDYEIQDPALTLNSSGVTTCPNPKHAWEQTTARVGCQEITFNGGDKLDGPVHSNDVMHICSATFTGAVTSSNPKSPYYKATIGADTSGATGSSCGGQTFSGGAPKYLSSMTIPPTNQNMQNETRTDDAQNVPRPGCLYTGPTKITFTSDGYMTVLSPYTKYTQTGPNVAPATGVTLENCGVPGPSGLASATGQKIPALASNLIYVQGVPGTATDPNYTAPSVSPWPTSPYPGCKSNSGTLVGNGIGFPYSTGSVAAGNLKNESAPSTAYGCRVGDVFVSGVVTGRVTIAAANYVYVTGNVTYGNATTDMLGLVGGAAVWVWNPVSTAGTIMLTDTDRTIDAAILSVNDTFTVQNYNVGPARGYLYVVGAIAQRYRGVVSQAGGYIKRYSYDSRFKATAPPKFLAPVSTTYGVTAYADVAKGYLADGTPQ